MQANTELFDQAVSLLNSKSYNKSIELFKQDLEENPNESITYNNIGVAQAHLGISQRDKSLLESAIQHLLKVIAIMEFSPGKSYPDAEKNLKWAREELNKLT
jgi:tetratricopeptide (TPR) repeat protein